MYGTCIVTTAGKKSNYKVKMAKKVFEIVSKFRYFGTAVTN
jgi:hypothetical protein